MSEKQGQSFEEHPPKQEEHLGILRPMQLQAEGRPPESPRKEREDGTPFEFKVHRLSFSVSLK